MEDLYSCLCCVDKALEVYLKDIVDVLYDGRCYMLSREELLPSIMKKLNKLKKVKNREAYVKIVKVKNITKSAMERYLRCGLRERCMTEIALEQILSICNEVIKHKYNKYS